MNDFEQGEEYAGKRIVKKLKAAFDECKGNPSRFAAKVFILMKEVDNAGSLRRMSHKN